jgi:GEVED domain/CARDB/Domain of unknown function DUF11/Secretion system C-terminal sorting domain
MNKRNYFLSPLSILLFLSVFFNQKIKAQNYCQSYGQAPWTEWIEGVQFGTINNVSGKSSNNSQSLTTNLTVGTSYPLSITQGFSWAADPTNQTQQGRAWIDFNRNGIYEDTELVASFNRTTTTANVTIPASAFLGSTGLRIALKTTGIPTPCEIFSKGEVEDYKVNITGGVTGSCSDLTAETRNVVWQGSYIQYEARLVGNSTNSAFVNYKIRDKNAFFFNETKGGLINTWFTVREWNGGADTVKNTINSNVGGCSFPLTFIRPQTGTCETYSINSINHTFSYCNEPLGTWGLLLTTSFNCNTYEATNGTLKFDYDGTIKLNGQFTDATGKILTMNATRSRDYGTVGTYQIGSGVVNDFAIFPISGGTLDTTVAANGDVFANMRFNISGAIGPTYLQLKLTNKQTATCGPVVTSPQPDLTLANLTVPTPSVLQGNILNFKVDAKNIGIAAATGNFTIKSYLSTDQILDASDYQNGSIPTANFTAGLTQTQIGGAMSVTNAVAAGNYYLILKIDADNQIAESNEGNNVIAYYSVTVTATPTNTCLSRFELEGFAPNQSDCFNNRLTGSPNFGNLQMYGNRIADGFMLNCIFNSNFARETHLFAKSAPSNTPPVNARFRNCAANWLYFTVSGVGRDERRDYVDENFNIRVRYWGAENNPDSIFVELDSTQILSNSSGALTFLSVRKTLNCNACFRNDVTPPFIACPTTTVTYNDPNFVNGDIIRTNKILPNTAITITETNCKIPNFVLTSINTNQQFFARGNTYPLSIVTYDSAGNKSNCAINMLIAPVPPNSDYCASKGTAPWEYWVGNVSLGTINNTSDKFKDFATLGYSDYTSLSATLNKGGSYPLSISPGLSWIGNLPNAYIRAWIDFNDNKVFDNNEIIYAKNNATSLIENVFIPLTAATGNVRMRVALKFGAYPTACETFDRGEVEDYTVNIAVGVGLPCTPNLKCPNDTTIIIAATEFAYCPSLNGKPPTFDVPACGAFLNSLSLNQQSCLQLGVTPLTWTMNFSNGSTASCTFNVTIQQQTPNTNGPDLTIANLNVPTPSVQQGQILNFKADLKNIGNAAATGSFTVKSYLSTIPVFNNRDYQDGVIPTANFAAGFTSTQVAGAMTVSSAVAAGQYYLILKIDADNQIVESNETNNYIVSAGLITVTSATTGGGADLALSIVSTPSVFRKFSVNTMRVTAQNVGNQTLANVKVELKRPALTSNGGSKVASVGSFQDFCPGGIECSEWTIPTLAAGATATLDAPFFVLDATAPIVVTTKLLSSTPTDANTANNTATVSVSPAATGAVAAVLGLRRQTPTQYIPLVVQSIAPNPTEGDVVVEVESLTAQDVQFEFSNAMGQVIQSEKRAVEKGTNQVHFDVYEFTQGMYFIQTNVGKGRNATTKFVKF